VLLKMPDRSKPGPLQATSPAPSHAESEPRYSVSSAADRWVRKGQATARGLGSATIFRNPSLAGSDDKLVPVAKISAANNHRARAANDAQGKAAAIADTLVRQPPAALDGNAPRTPVLSDTIDIEHLSRNLVRLVEQSGKAVAACLSFREQGALHRMAPDEAVGVARTFGHLAEYWLTHPQQAIQVQANLGKACIGLWASATKRLLGVPDEPVATSGPRERRFTDPEWTSHPYFDLLKQAYLLTAQWADCLVADAKGLDPHTRRKAEFYVRQLIDAMSPANFLLTNPELMRETMSSNAGNLADGMGMLFEDIETGQGCVDIRRSDRATFEVGRNLAITPGKVIHQNELMQLIQYTPATRTVLKRPILIVPPWINKYYILDLTPEKSFVNWCVDQGLTVFLISWVNPDAKLASKRFDDYMREGPLAALDVVAAVTGGEKAHTAGYCAGGTLLAATLAYMAAKGDHRALSATLLTTQVDFTHAGDIMAFIDEEQVGALESCMSKQGFLDGHKMAAAFNLLRSNDLVWPYVVNNYLRGRPPKPFDLLHWNSDSTRIPAASHSFYLRNCYLENKLAKGELTLDGETIDLGNVTIPIYSLATREDHIAPAKSVFLGSKLFGGQVEFVVAGSGHIAGVINPPSQIKYSYWVGGPAVTNLETWLAKAEERPGSWWPHWLRWIKEQDPTEVLPRHPGSGEYQPLEDAPGSYVKVRY